MTPVLEQPSESLESDFQDRRQRDGFSPFAGLERRQFVDSRDELSPEARDLARAIDDYKLQHRRRFINFEEMLHVVKSLGYEKNAECKMQNSE